MAESDAVFSLSVNGRLSFQPGRKGFAGTMPNLMIRMNDTSNAATLVISGHNPSTNKFSLRTALQSGLLALYDLDNDTKVTIPPADNEPSELTIEAGARPQWHDLTLNPQNDFWNQILTPGHNYEIRWQPNSSNAPFAYHGPSKPQDPTHHLPVQTFSSTIKISVFDPSSTPPQLSISLSPTAKTCHLSGTPRFGFKLEITSHDATPLTICLNKTPLKELHGLEEIAHTVDQDGEEVEWPYGIGCWEGKEPFPDDGLFEEFKPGVPYERVFWLEEYDKETANGGELGVLDKGETYTVSVSKELRGSFWMWRRGGKGEMLAGSEKEKEERWRESSGPIMLEVSEPFTFETV
ncbi:hypothetical protein T440DRAFT_318528 [Plenodomus tracheiphilus IPT5]|uniref:Uncharacterized protein n=1 Tax=Plenodomus tracheiphilus IPT5 TaxID=1408161 RepID=A0A6A7BEH2_9PLEO|nr:hypothetical protein T440DRAFT_318528 [Plenodomus tracheiphilus IPT5]